MLFDPTKLTISPQGWWPQYANGITKLGHTNNLAHPALSGLVVELFYTGSNAVGNLFPEVFANEVPRAAVALTATVIKLALDEVATEGKEVTFKRDVYADVYVDIMGLMVKCDTSPVHCAKTKALRVHWAKIGRNGGDVSTMTGFDVDLD
ncbi:hypothetical protein OG21DRAFT_1491518 [Imleria badia]|nr:hypothetical protein OG21DRAFT_1491518 [Imleria badia]